jgi:hypothetical protein
MEKGPLLHHFGNAPADTFGALGAGAQVVIVVPSRSLVVVRQGPIMRTQPRPDWLIEPILAAMT